jgi:predicted ArsR family transcriptional regulator
MSDKNASAERAQQVEKLRKTLSSRATPYTIEELAAKFKVEGNTIRQWLRTLGDAVTATDAPKKKAGKGRPPKQYTIAAVPVPKG